MSDDVFPLKPAHPLASGSEISESRSLLLYRGEMTGRWFDVAVTTTTRSTSSGGDTQTKAVHAELDASGVGEVALKLSPDPHRSGCSGTSAFRWAVFPFPPAYGRRWFHPGSLRRHSPRGQDPADLPNL